MKKKIYYTSTLRHKRRVFFFFFRFKISCKFAQECFNGLIRSTEYVYTEGVLEQGAEENIST